MWSISCETASGEYHRTSLTISQHRKQTITWVDADPDLCHHMISLGQNESSKIYVWSSLLSHFWLSTIYDKIYIRYIGKSHLHSMTLRNGCRHGNDSIAAGRTRGCRKGRPWCNRQRQSRRHDDPRSSVDKIHYNISIKPLKHNTMQFYSSEYNHLRMIKLSKLLSLWYWRHGLPYTSPLCRFVLVVS